MTVIMTVILYCMPVLAFVTGCLLLRLIHRSTWKMRNLAKTTTISYLWDTLRFRAGENITAKLIVHTHSLLGEEIDLPALYPKIKLRIKYQNELFSVFNNFENSVLIAFNPKKAGTYQLVCSYVALWFFEFEVQNSKFDKLIEAAQIDASQTEFFGQRNGEVLTVSVGMLYVLAIQPKDRYKNDCRVEDVELNLFYFQAQQIDVVRHDGNNMAIEDTSLVGFFEITQERQLCLNLQMRVAGLWKGRLLYNNQPISGGEFVIIAINHQEEHELKRVLNDCTSIRDTSFQVVVEIMEVNYSPRFHKILMTISPKAVVFFKVYDRNEKSERVAVFRVSLRAQIIFKRCGLNNWYKFEVADGIQSEVTFWIDNSSGRRLLSLFSHYRVQCDNYKGFSYETKKATFFQELTSQLKPTTITASRRINVSQQDLVRTSWLQVKRFTRDEWVKLDFVSFEGFFVEESDENLSISFWLSSLMQVIFNPDEDKDALHKSLFSKYAESEYVHPTPLNYREVLKWPNEFYSLAGLVLGKYLVDMAFDKIKEPIFSIALSRSLLAMIIGHPPTYEYVKLDHPSVYKARFQPVLNAMHVERLHRTFSEEFDMKGNLLKKPVDLVVGGSKIAVTTEHIETYLNCLAKYYMCTTVLDEVHALRTGFYRIIPEELLSNLDIEDLEKLFLLGKNEKKPWVLSWLFSFFSGGNDKNNESIPGQVGPWEKCRGTKSVPTLCANAPPQSLGGSNINEGRPLNSQQYSTSKHGEYRPESRFSNNNDTEFQTLHRRQNTLGRYDSLMDIDY